MSPTCDETVGADSHRPTEDDLKEGRRQLYQQIGWCMIRLQQIELGLKWLAGRTDFQSPAGAMTDHLERHAARISKQTLGSVTEVVSVGLLKPLDWEPPSDDTDEPLRSTIRFGMSIGLEDDHLESVRDRLKGLVARRNFLVHGLILRYDIWTAEGCADASSYVDETLALADAVRTDIREWTSGLDELDQILASPEIQELILGVNRGHGVDGE